MDLLGNDSDDEGVTFKINENYAKNYDKWRKKEEKQKLLDKYGDADLSTSSSEEEEIRSTPQMDKDWLRTYAVIRFQQPRLYKEGEKFFHDKAKPVNRKKEKATTLKDHERKFLLEKGGIESDEDSKSKQPESKSYFEEQEEIKQSFKEAFGDSDDEEEGLLVKKEKTAEEKKKEENDFLEWLKGRKDELDDEEAAAELAPLKAYWNDPNLNEKERVLRDYILNNGYIDQEGSDESDDEGLRELPNFNAEEDFLEKAEEYEHKYNFRHEEPGGDELKSYPRVIETSVRTKDTRRADQRQRKLDKKKTIKEQRQEEIRLLQKIQMEERKEKLEKLRKIADKPDLEYDLDADFDPDEHNKLMQKYFNEDYYGDDEGELKKPEFEYDAGVDDEPDDWWQERIKEEEGAQDVEEEYYEPGPDDPDFIMDADYDPSQDYKREKNKNKKKKKGLVEKLPVFDPAEKTFEEYIEECLKGKINTIPFTYREVVPNDYGLSTEEILKAPERELNSWVSVKKMSQYKSKQEELAERRKFQSRAHNVDKKVKILPSLLDKEPKEKKKKPQSQSNLDSGENDQSEMSSNCQSAEKKKKKPQSQSNLDSGENDQSEMSSSCQSAEKKKKKKRKLPSETNNHSESGEKKKSKLKIETNFDVDFGEKKMSKIKTEGNCDLDKVVQKKIKLEIETNSDTELGEKKKLKLKTEANCDLGKVEKKKFKLEIETNSDTELGEKKKSKLHIETNSVSKTDKKKKLKSETNTNFKIEKLKTETNEDFEFSKRKDIKIEWETNTASEFGDKNEIKQQTETNTDSEIVTKETAGTNSNTGLRKKKKKKKISIKNFGTANKNEKKVLDSRQLERQLSKVMSAARLSKYGLGPNAVKMKKKKKKQKISKNVH